MVSQLYRTLGNTEINVSPARFLSSFILFSTHFCVLITTANQSCLSHQMTYVSLIVSFMFGAIALGIINQIFVNLHQRFIKDRHPSGK